MDQMWALLWHTLHEKISVVAVVIISMTNGCRGHCKAHKFITSWVWTFNRYKWKNLTYKSRLIQDSFDTRAQIILKGATLG